MRLLSRGTRANGLQQQAKLTPSPDARPEVVVPLPMSSKITDT